MSEILGRLNRTIEAQGPDSLLVQARDALADAYQTISDLHERADLVAREHAADVQRKQEAIETLAETLSLVQAAASAAESEIDRWKTRTKQGEQSNG